jgi:hypothetical protein
MRSASKRIAWVDRKRARDQALYDDEAVVPPRPVQLV